MNKNTILAMLLILITVTLFSNQNVNKFIYEKIYPGKPFVDNNTNNKKKDNEKKEIASELKSNEQLKSLDSYNDDTNQVKKNIEQNIDSIKNDTIWIETDRIIIGIDEKGADIISAKMKNYRYDENKSEERKKGELIDLIPEGNQGGAQVSIEGDTLSNKHFEYVGDKKSIKVENNDKKNVKFTSSFKGKIIEKEYIFSNGTYKVDMNISQEGLSGEPIEVSWKGGIEESEPSKTMETELRTVHYSDGKYVEHIQMNKEERETPAGNYKWVGITSKYFFISIVSEKNNDADITINSFKQKNEYKDKKKKDNTINYSVSYKTTADENIAKFWFYIGPNNYNEIKSFDIGFNKILFPVLSWARHILFSDKWFPWIAEFVLIVLLKLFSLVKDYGVAILLLTLLMRIVTFPLTQSSMKSMNRMKDVQPKIEQLRQKHKNNPKKMNEELMTLYRKEGINPLNPGCLPIFLQMPIFFALFVVLRKAIELRGSGTVIIPWIHDLSKAEVLISLEKIFPGGIPLYGSNIALLPIIMAVLTYFQNKMTIKDPNQKMLIWFMPIFMLVLFNSFASGLVLYWTFSSALQIVQQYYLDKTSKKMKIEKVRNSKK